MTIKSQTELAGLLRCLVGLTTADLDAIGERFLQRYGARPKVTYRCPGAACISINDEAVHGVPGSRVIQPGDLVSIDVSARHGFSVLSELSGHGARRGLHEDPAVPNIDVPRLKHKLHTGLVITTEPHISAKPSRLLQDDDGWTLRTANGSLSASYEHTVVVMPDRAVV